MIEDKNKLDELVDAEGGVIDGDRNVTGNSEIETGPVQKPFNDDSNYEKGMSTTTDRASRYTQDIPWFAVYTSGRSARVNETKRKVTKQELEEEIKEDIVKKSNKDREVLDKEYDGKTDKLIDTINDSDLTNKQLEKIKKAVLDKLMNKNG